MVKLAFCGLLQAHCVLHPKLSQNAASIPQCGMLTGSAVGNALLDSKPV